ncbi:MAG: hypothetical protein WD825_07350 [Gemmatimonadaceae bacterium]
MRRCLMAILVIGVVAITPRDAAAQVLEAADYAAWALGGTPAGGLTPMMAAPGTKGEKAFNNFSGRFSHHAPKTGDGSNSIGASFLTAAGSNAAVSGTIGYLMVACPAGATCDNVIMLGGDVHSTLWNSATDANKTTRTSVNLQGGLGYGKQGDLGYLSAVVGVPLAISMEQASKARISAFINPAFGWGRVSMSGAAGSGSESGTTPMVGLGGSWTAPAGWGLHASFNKILVEDSGNSFGLGFSYNLK